MTTLPGAEQVDRFRRGIARHLGLHFDDGKLALLADVLRGRLEALKQGTDAYLARLEAAASADESQALARALTVAETFFFRHIEQFRAFSEIALPDRARAAQEAGRRLQILSAGCASGEEPYSLAMLVREAAGVRPSDVDIVGVDINPAMLEKAARGRFSSWVLRETPPDTVQRWFRSEGREFVLDDVVRNAVRFELRNLAGAAGSTWLPEAFDVIFCRNVLMYFTPEGAQMLVERLASTLHTGGYLFLGHAETLRGLSSDFHLRQTHGAFYYQRRGRLRSDVRALDHTAPAPSIRQTAIRDLVDDAGTWVEAIRQASSRIEALAESPSLVSARAGAGDGLVRPRWDVGLALELLEKERFAEALELVQALPPEWDSDAEVLLLHAVLLTHGGELSRAERACERLLEIDELNAGAHYLLALCREGAGDRAGSIRHDQAAIYLDPGFAMAHLHLGLLARRASDSRAARGALRQAMALLPREDASRLLLFGGGFGRDTLVSLCRAELAGCGGNG